MGCFAQSMRNELRLQTTVARISQLEEMLENRRRHRAAEGMKEVRAAKSEQSRRKEGLRVRGRELVEVRRSYVEERKGADEKRRQRDQALFTYLLPVSVLVFSLCVYLASSEDASASSSLLLDALWRVPYHDLLYGSCRKTSHSKGGSAASSATSATSASSSTIPPPAPAIKIVQHETRRIAGAAKRPPPPSTSSPTSSLITSYLSSYLFPAGSGAQGIYEAGFCYLQQTFILLLGLLFTIFVHHLMGWVGLSGVRAKVHVGLIMWYCRSYFAMLTWKSLLSVRSLLAFHALLWIVTWWKDAGHAFPRRGLVVHGVVPLVALSVGVYDACRYVNAAEPVQGFVLILGKVMEAIWAAASSGGGGGGGGGGEQGQSV